VSGLDIDLLDYLTLEVETDPTGLVNLLENPSGDLGGWGYVTPLASSAVTRDSLLAALNYFRSVAGASYFTSELLSVTAGQWLAARYGQVAVANAYHKVRFEWYDSAGVLLSSSAQSALRAPAGSSSSEVTAALYGPLQAPASTAYAKLRIDLYTSAGANPTGGHFFKFRHATVAKAATSGALATLDYVAPIEYQDILSGSASLEINRAALDVGVIQALVKDASLDPATADLIRPGKRVRLMALNNDTATQEVLAQGRVDKARVTYDLRKAADKQATITLATVDANQVLANTNRPEGVATIADLPQVLEGARVPWNVNGSGNQVWTATVVAMNDQASVLDQVILARDSDLGYAWTSKEGVLTAYEDRTLDYYGTGVALLDESDYSGLDVTFDVADCINEVLVVYRRWAATTGDTEEVTYGPYRDAASIEEWGVHQATFTVQGIGEANVAAYAASILAANAQPARRINSVQVPIRTAADLVKTKALLDLYAKVRVVNADKGLDQTLRPTRIQHQIRPKRWTMTLEFDQVDSVAVPIPSTPQGTPGAVPWTNLTFTGPSGNVRYRVVNGIVFIEANATIASLVSGGTLTLVTAANGVPAAYRPGQSLFQQSARMNGGNTFGVLGIFTDGSITVSNQSGAASTGVQFRLAYPIG
jgi:hypothetical protein